MWMANIWVGLVLLAFGRRLFWLFVGCIGFVAGYAFVQRFAGVQSDLLLIVISLFSGLLGALLAIFFQKLAVALAGLVAGGYIGISIIPLMSLGGDQLLWVFYVIGGFLGAILLFLIFDWTIILISSLSGASLIVQTIELGIDKEIPLFMVLVVFGLIFQAIPLMKDRRSEESNCNERRIQCGK